MQWIVHELVLVFSYQPHLLLPQYVIIMKFPERTIDVWYFLLWNSKTYACLLNSSLPTQLIHMVFFMYSFCVLADHGWKDVFFLYLVSELRLILFFFFFFQPSPHSPCYYFQEILAAFPYLIISSLISKMLCIQWVMLILELVLTVSVPVKQPL